jgi:hypothetical protein
MPAVWMLNPEACAETANLKIAPTVTSTMPNVVRPIPEPLFIFSPLFDLLALALLFLADAAQMLLLRHRLVQFSCAFFLCASETAKASALVRRPSDYQGGDVR